MSVNSISNSDPENAHVGKRVKLGEWICRVCFTVVFLVNVQCALGFAFDPESHVGGFQLSGVAGAIAVQGVGIAFLMWNATYPAFIIDPRRFKVLGWVILAQQLLGLVGECVLYANLVSSPMMAASYHQLSESILRFIQFDAAGFVLMSLSFACLLVMEINR